MTRGQESLLADDTAPLIRQPAILSTDASRPTLRVLQPSAEELAEHALQLVDIGKASKGSCLWAQLEGTA